MRLILASASSTRKSIMDKLNIKYDIVTSDIEEKSDKEDPQEYVKELSKNKALAVAKKVNNNTSLIIAADTIIYKEPKRYEKPKNIDVVINNLKELSGKKNQGITGVAIYDTSTGKCLNFSCTTDVYFKKISDEDILWYINNEEGLLYKAGYSLDGIMSLFIDRIDGEYYNVLGLPIGMIYTKINELGYHIKDFN